MTLCFLVGIVLCTIAAGLVAKHRSRTTIQPLDVEAFHRLLDRDDEMFLRKNISLVASLQLKCQRIRVSGRYLCRIANNATAFIQLGASVRTTPNSEIGQAASRIVDLGTRLRFQCLVASIKLGAELVFPFLSLAPIRLAQDYQTLRGNVFRFNALRSQRAFAPPTIVLSHSAGIPPRRLAPPHQQKNERDADDLEEGQRTTLWGPEIERTASRF
jgi:hypothetical protein